MAGDERFTPGEIRRALESIQGELKELRGDIKKYQAEAAKRKVDCNTEFFGAISATNKDVNKNTTDVDWLKRGFWYLAGIGSAALLLTVGTVIASAFGG